MQSIGERLEEARKRMGASIQDAANETKIRRHFLLSFENNNFDIGLPEIYCRGFLKIYTNFLKIDPERILADYQAIQLGSHGTNVGDNREFFGHIKIDETPSEINKAPAAAYEQSSDEDEDINEGASNSNIYKKAGLMAGGAFAAIIAIALIINYFSNPNSPEINTELDTDTTNIASVTDEEIFLIAKDDVHVIVRQELDKKRLYSGTLTKGQRLPLTKKGQIKIRFNEGENLLLEKGGQRYSMNAQGVAVRAFD